MCRELDWGRTPLGCVDAWPASLRSVAALVLRQGMPQCVCWGPELRQIYNDGYRVILGDKHPAALGKPVLETWSEIAGDIAPLFARLFAGETVYFEDLPLRVHRNGREQDACFTFSYSPVLNDAGEVGGALVNCFETTNQVAGRRTEAERDQLARALEVERDRLARVFHQSPSFLAVLRGPDDVYEMVNPAYERFIGEGREVVGKPLFEALPETRGQGFEVNHRHVRETGEPMVFREMRVMIARTPGAEPEERYIDVTYLPLLEADGSHPAIIAHGADVTEHVRARRAVEHLLAVSEAGRAEAEAAQKELAEANAQLQDQALELELTNQQLQDNAVELEVQTEELQITAAQLQERSRYADSARADAEAGRQRTDAVLASIADAFYLLDREWRFTHVNAAAEPLLQSTRDQLIGRTLWDAFPGVIGSVFEGPYREAMECGRVTSAEAYFAPLGTWFDVRTYPWPGGLMVHFRDIGPRKAAEAEREELLIMLKAANAELQVLTSEAREAERQARFLADLGQALQPLLEPGEVMATAAAMLGDHVEADRCAYAEVEADEDHFTITGDYVRGNTPRIVGRFAMSAFGAEALRLSREDQPYVVDDVETDSRVPEADRPIYALVGIRAVISVPLLKAGRFVAGMAVHQRTPRRWTSDEVALVRTVAQRCWESLERARVVRLLRESEAALRATAAQLIERTDLAEQARLAAEAAKSSAEAANRAKSEFLSTMSHELRTPLNAIAGYTQLMSMGLRGPLSEQQRQDLERIDRASQHLMGLVTDVLNFARIDAGQLELHVIDFELATVISDLEPLIAPQFGAKGVGFDHDGCSCDTSDRPHVVRADPEKFRQILLNLLTNAVKFTEAGGRVSLACESDVAANVVRVRVSDTGRGIPAHQLDAIFAPFVQVDRHRTHESQQGVGLGLAISRDLAYRMDGDLTVDSTPGVGSTFILTLPAPSAIAAAPVEPSLAP